MNKASVAITNLLPLPNTGAANAQSKNLFVQLPVHRQEDRGDVKIDQVVSSALLPFDVANFFQKQKQHRAAVILDELGPLELHGDADFFGRPADQQAGKKGVPSTASGSINAPMLEACALF